MQYATGELDRGIEAHKRFEVQRTNNSGKRSSKDGAELIGNAVRPRAAVTFRLPKALFQFRKPGNKTRIKSKSATDMLLASSDNVRYLLQGDVRRRFCFRKVLVPNTTDFTIVMSLGTVWSSESLDRSSRPCFADTRVKFAQVLPHFSRVRSRRLVEIIRKFLKMLGFVTGNPSTEDDKNGPF